MKSGNLPSRSVIRLSASPLAQFKRAAEHHFSAGDRIIGVVDPLLEFFALSHQRAISFLMHSLGAPRGYFGGDFHLLRDQTRRSHALTAVLQIMAVATRPTTIEIQIAPGAQAVRTFHPPLLRFLRTNVFDQANFDAVVAIEVKRLWHRATQFVFETQAAWRNAVDRAVTTDHASRTRPAATGSLADLDRLELFRIDCGQRFEMFCHEGRHRFREMFRPKKLDVYAEN